MPADCVSAMPGPHEPAPQRFPLTVLPVTVATTPLLIWMPLGAILLGSPGPLSKPSQPPDDEPPLEALTERESEILGMIAQGLSNKEIAAGLNLTEGTVRNYSSAILAKLHVYDRTQAVIKAARHGIVKL